LLAVPAISFAIGGTLPIVGEKGNRHMFTLCTIAVASGEWSVICPLTEKAGDQGGIGRIGFVAGELRFRVCRDAGRIDDKDTKASIVESLGNIVAVGASSFQTDHNLGDVLGSTPVEQAGIAGRSVWDAGLARGLGAEQRNGYAVFRDINTQKNRYCILLESR
jgi:hypothetical protein